jgi:hypothetical protein
VGLNVCPHCDFHRVRKTVPIPAPAPAPRLVVEQAPLAEAPRMPSRSMLVILLAMLATFRRRA